MKKSVEFISTALLAVLVGIGCYQLYMAVTYARIRLGPPQWHWTSMETDPIGFWFAVFVNAGAVILLGGFLLLILHGWRSERRWFLYKARKPNIDPAIRRDLPNADTPPVES